MKIAIGCDHGALALKEALIPFLINLGHSVKDFGTCTTESCDYPDHAIAAARAVADGDCDRGIVLCTTGIGVSIAANKVKGIRCALLSDVNSAIMTRLHNDTNMMAMGAAVVDRNLAYSIVEAWLSTPFSNEERHQRRIDKVMDSERGFKKKRSRKRRRRKSVIGKLLSFLVAKPLTILISILLVLSLVLTPLATYVTSMTDPSRVVDILFSSGIFGNPEPPTEAPEAPSEGGDASGPADGEDPNAPADGEDLNAPADGEDLNAPADGEDLNTPADGEDANTPAGGEDANTPSDNQDTNTPSEDEDPNAPATIAEEDPNTPADGEVTDTPADGEDTDVPAEGENTDTPADGENTDTPADGENTDAPDSGDTTPPTEDSQSPSGSISAAQGLLDALQNVISSGMMDEDLLHSSLGIPEDTSIDTERLCAELVQSGAAQALVSAYITDTMNAAMGSDKEPSLTSETVMDLIAPHISELADIVESCLPDGTEVKRAALEEATLAAAQASLPALVDELPDASEAIGALTEQAPMLGKALEALKFIRNGGLRAAVLLLVITLIVILCFFRLPGLRGLRCVGICGVVSATFCYALSLLLGMVLLQDLLAKIPVIGSLIIEFSTSFAHEFTVCAVIYGVIGLFLILSTTILRGFFSMLFGAIFSRD